MKQLKLQKNHLIGDKKSQIVFTPSETKVNAALAGLLLLQRLSLIDSASLLTSKSMLFSLPKIWYHVILATMAVMEVIFRMHGDTSRDMEFQLTNANLTNQARLGHLDPAKKLVMISLSSQNYTNASKEQ